MGITRRKLIPSFSVLKDEQKFEWFIERMNEEIIHWHVAIMEGRIKNALTFGTWSALVEEKFGVKKIDSVDLCSIKMNKDEKISEYMKRLTEKSRNSNVSKEELSKLFEIT